MSHLKKIIHLIEKTGDRAIILEEGEPAYVILPFREYEKLFGEDGNPATEVRQNQEVRQKISENTGTVKVPQTKNPFSDQRPRPIQPQPPKAPQTSGENPPEEKAEAEKD